MEKEDALRKIKKLMAIADDESASDQEIQLAALRANKLMIQYKIDRYELYGNQEQKVVKSVMLNEKSSGYFHWVLRSLVKSFSCMTSYKGKINSDTCEFDIWGLPDDVELCLPVAEGLLFYLKNMLLDLKDCYIGLEDFRVFKREYYQGFAQGLKVKLEKAYLEMHLDQKYELAVTEVPAIVQESFKKGLRTINTSYSNFSEDGYNLGKKHGSQYDIDRNDLIGVLRKEDDEI